LGSFFLFIHVIVSFLLIVVVLLQSGKSADLAGAFGGGGSQSTFGPRGAASFLSKMTTTLAVLFMITSLVLALMADSKAGKKSVISDKEIPQVQEPINKDQQPAKDVKDQATPNETSDQSSKVNPKEIENTDKSEESNK
jgi:preprotein translocase subunit SecG